ncbi:MarR family transcriptional regulator [Rhodococcus sp. IEGM 1379]|uniref:MarR family transcriptional regulator n=1 Tax=Rhodococcus sp. IEGM 1379 TaxID=3047086 RepID=UPI0024B6F4AE|nr:MarR family transcriptional regulator [Rhodococcus sp. IEGM 1379]MDI9913923.1 MarR family transcriptional regulator [Rhodococcus sp. IEGM 1379]
MVTPETAESVIYSLGALVRRHREIAWAESHGQTRGALPDAMGALLSLMSADEVNRTTELAAKLRITASTLSRHAAQAEDAGYLQRQADPSNGRASLERLRRPTRDNEQLSVDEPSSILSFSPARIILRYKEAHGYSQVHGRSTIFTNTATRSPR